MDLELTPAEAEQFQAALLSAFPNRGDLKQLVYFRVEQELDQLVPPGTYANNVTDLIKWANAAGKAWALLSAAHDKVPGSPKLRDFYQRIKARLPSEDETERRDAGGPSGLPPRALTPPLRQQLVGAVMLIPTSGTYEGRTAYLLGLPSSLSRNANDARADLDTTFAQLDGLGRLESGQWPLLLVIDNILQYVQGFPDVQNVISHVRQSLEQAYAAH
jgi:hypothetical protein